MMITLSKLTFSPYLSYFSNLSLQWFNQYEKYFLSFSSNSSTFYWMSSASCDSIDKTVKFNLNFFELLSVYLEFDRWRRSSLHYFLLQMRNETRWCQDNAYNFIKHINLRQIQFLLIFDEKRQILSIYLMFIVSQIIYIQGIYLAWLNIFNLIYM